MMMNVQQQHKKQCRPFLAPVQPSQLHLATNEKGVKRFRGSAGVYTTKTDEDQQQQKCDVAVMAYSASGAENDEYFTSSTTTTTFRAQQPNPFSYFGRPNGTPLPPLQWANEDEVWKQMCWKEHIYVKDPNLFQRHPQVTPKMRAVLFEWISEVCEVYKLHRETFYLCMDFVDRYLSVESQIPKRSLQLVGVTALFIAAKLEEIYPPQVKEFAYVTDQACAVEEILELELVMLKALKWALYPVTVNHWLTLYMQVIANKMNVELYKKGMIDWHCKEFAMPQFQRLDYIRLTQLTDLCSLDPGSLRYSYSVIAAAAVFHVLQAMHLTFVASGYAFPDLEQCINWMAPFAQVIKEEDVHVKMFPEIPHDDMHNIQAHFVALPLWEKAQRITTSVPVATDIFPTPPRSADRSAAATALAGQQRQFNYT